MRSYDSWRKVDKMFPIRVRVLRYTVVGFGFASFKPIYREVDGYGVRVDGNKASKATDDDIRSQLIGEKDEIWWIEAPNRAEAEEKTAEMEGFKVGTKGKALELAPDQPEIVVDCGRLFWDADDNLTCRPHPECRQGCVIDKYDPPDNCPYPHGVPSI